MSSRYVWQWYWDYDYLGNKYKAIYFGPRLETKEKKEMKILILTGLVAIIIILLFIAVMIYAIGEKISEK